MSENKKAPTGGDGCLVHAGILVSHGGNKANAKLTSGYKNAAKEKFIQEVIDEIIKPDPGSDISFPVGEKNPPVTNNEVFKDLADENKFKAFHELILTQYQNIAISLEAPSNFEVMKKGAPIVDPVALGTKFGVKPKVEKLSDFTKFLAPNPALLAAEFSKAGLKDPIIKGSPITPVGMLKKLTDLKSQLPNYEPPVPPTPTTEPQLAPNLVAGSCGATGPSLHVFQKAFAENIGPFMAKMIVSAPTIAIQITTKGPTAAISAIANLVESSGLVGAPLNHSSGAPQDVLMRAVRKVMTRKIAEMCMFHTIGITLGSSVNGLVGIMAGSNSTKSAAPTGPALAGTEVIASKAAKIEDNGIISEEELGGNLPDGQIYPLIPQIPLMPVSDTPMPPKPPGATAESDTTPGGYGIPHGGDRYDPEEEIESLPEELKKAIKAGLEQEKEEIEKNAGNNKKEKEITEGINQQFPDQNLPYPPPVAAKVQVPEPPSPTKPPEVIVLDDEGFPYPNAGGFAPRSYDLPPDEPLESEPPPVPAYPPAAGGSDVRGAIVQKALSSAGLRWSSNRNEYSSCIFYAEFAVNPSLAISMAKVASSCGVFARACLQSAGASYYLNPKDKSFKEVNTAFPSDKTYTPKDADPSIKSAVGATPLASDYFNGFYGPPSSIVAALSQMAKRRGALINKGVYNKMPKVRAGDILIIGEPAHVIVVVQDFDPTKDKIMHTVEGGQQDAGNVGTASYRKEPGILASAIKKIRHGYNFTPTPTPNEYDTRKITDIGGLLFGKKVLQFAIDSEIFITGKKA